MSGTLPSREDAIGEIKKQIRRQTSDDLTEVAVDVSFLLALLGENTEVELTPEQIVEEARERIESYQSSLPFGSLRNQLDEDSEDIGGLLGDEKTEVDIHLLAALMGARVKP